MERMRARLLPIVAVCLPLCGYGVPAADALPPVPEVRVTVDPAETVTATIVRATVTATVADARIACLRVAWGDGSSDELCGYGAGGSAPGGASRVFTHSYRRPGAWVVVATATAENSAAEHGEGHAVAPVRVLPGPTPSNGPARPRGYPAQVQPARSDRRVTYVDVIGTDPDGWVVGSVVEWGDGARSRATYGTTGCNDPLLHWPAGAAPPFTPGHRYRRPGTYVVTVRVTSAGCDGADEQTTVERLRVRVPARG